MKNDLVTFQISQTKSESRFILAFYDSSSSEIDVVVALLCIVQVM